MVPIMALIVVFILYRQRKDHRRLKAVRWIILLGWLVQYSCIYPSFDALGEFFDNCCR